MNIVAIIQARTRSTRCPGKVLFKFNGKPMLYWICLRVGATPNIDQIYVTCPDYDHKEFTKVLKDLEAKIIPWKKGENDLVARYADVARLSQADFVVRIPADNPCVDPMILKSHITRYLTHPTAFSSSQLYSIHDKDIDGLGGEICLAGWYAHLDWALPLYKGKEIHEYREHPHLWFKDHNLQHLPYFQPPIDRTVPLVRLDINTHEDYERLKPHYEALNTVNPCFNGLEIVERLTVQDQCVK